MNAYFLKFGGVEQFRFACCSHGNWRSICGRRVSLYGWGTLKSHAICLLLSLSLSTAVQAEQFCNENLRASSPSMNFQDNGNSTVTHKTTGLMWKKCVEGQSGVSCENDSPTFFNWPDALQYAYSHEFAGYDNWRVPNIKELASIVEESCNSPAINLSTFPNYPNVIIWSSSPNVSLPDHVWGISFYDGSISNGRKPSAYRMHLVRDIEQIAPELTSSRRVIESGTEITLSWNTQNWNETECELTGGGITPNPLLTDGGDPFTGSINRTLSATTTFNLTCGSLSDSVTVEVIGGGGET